MAYEFDHERMDVYRVALEVARWIRRQTFPAETTHLRDQALRATEGLVLNIAEGMGRKGRAGRNHFRIALGSAAEASAVLDLVDLPEAADQRNNLRRTGAMLRRLT